jgi:hypothetical protein
LPPARDDATASDPRLGWEDEDEGGVDDGVNDAEAVVDEGVVADEPCECGMTTSAFGLGAGSSMLDKKASCL